MITIYKEKDYEGMSRRAANIIAAHVILEPASVLGLATGGTPVGTYQRLISMYNDGDLDFSEIRTVNLDEYCGLDGTNDQSYRYFMDTNLFKHVNIDIDNTNVPDGRNTDAKAECLRYDTLIEDLGGIDLQLLGLGGNGHIGFNEPDSAFAKHTHCVTLKKDTIEANSRFFDRPEDVPTKAYTMGIGTIFMAGRILLIVSGEGKADILKEALEGPITPAVPASILQLHPDVTIVGDEAALKKLSDKLIYSL